MNQMKMIKEINMKTIIAAAAISSLSTIAMAGGVDLIGNVEYLVEAEALETTVGVEYFALNTILLTAVIDASYNVVNEAGDVDGATIAAQYELTNDVATYVSFDLDKDFRYEEVTVGVGFRF